MLLRSKDVRHRSSDCVSGGWAKRALLWKSLQTDFEKRLSGLGSESVNVGIFVSVLYAEDGPPSLWEYRNGWCSISDLGIWTFVKEVVYGNELPIPPGLSPSKDVTSLHLETLHLGMAAQVHNVHVSKSFICFESRNAIC